MSNLHLKAFRILSPLQSGWDDVVRLSDAEEAVKRAVRVAIADAWEIDPEDVLKERVADVLALLQGERA
jgi:hypothetical protein